MNGIVGGRNMGKSILKKILAVVLTVAVIVGVIEIPPYVKADVTHPDSVTGVAGTNTLSETLSINFSVNGSGSFVYNGEVQNPTITAVVNNITTPETQTFSNVGSGDENFKVTYQANAKNANFENDEYYEITIESRNPAFCDFATQHLYYQIKKATPQEISYTLAENIVTWDGAVHEPQFSSVTVKVGSRYITASPDDYHVESTNWDFISAEQNRSSKIVLETTNFTTAESVDITGYYIAYDLSDTSNIVAMLGTEAGASSGTPTFTKDYGYSANDLTTNYALFNRNAGISGANVDLTAFDPSYEKDGTALASMTGTLFPGSTYSITYDCGSGIMRSGGYVYRGSRTSTVHIKSKQFDNLSIKIKERSDSSDIVLDRAHTGSGQSQFPSVVYNSAAQAKPYSIDVYDGSTLLSLNSDYTLSFSPNSISVGTVTVTVTGAGEYSDAGSVTFKYYINSDLMVNLGSAEVEFGNGRGTNEAPSFTVSDASGTASVARSQYDVIYGYVDANGTDTDVDNLTDPNMGTVGTKYVYARGKLVYSGQVSAKAYFNVVPAKLPYSGQSDTAANSRFNMELAPGNSTYTGSNVSQGVTITDTYLGTSLTQGTDFDISYYKKSGNDWLAVTECVDSGLYQVRAYGAGTKYDSGTYAAAQFRIGAIDVSNASLDTNIIYYAGASTKAPSVTYTNGGRTTVLYDGQTGTCAAGITVTFDGTESTPGKTISNQHTITVVGTNDNFTGTLSRHYEVRKAALKDLLTAQSISVEWMGTDAYETLPDLSKLVFKEADGHIISSDNYTITSAAANNVPGTGKLMVTPLGDYADLYDAGEIDYTIAKRSMNHFAIELGAQSMVLDNTDPAYGYTYPQLKLVDTVSGDDIVIPAAAYTVNYTDNTQAGSLATITFTAAGGSNYTGTINKTFTCGIDISTKGSVTLSFTRAGRPVNKDTGLVYTGSSIVPNSILVNVDMGNDIVDLVQGVDYDVTYRNLTSGRANDTTSAGTVEVTITAKDDTTVYFGTLTETYTINTITLSNSNTRIYWEGDTPTNPTEHNFTYSGVAIEPNTLKVEVDLDGDDTYELLTTDDYELKYLNNINQTVSANFPAYVYVATKEGSNYNFPELRGTTYQTIANSAVIHTSFNIRKANISSVGIQLDAYEYDYDGKSHTPNVTATYNERELRKGTDYNVVRCLDDTNSSVYAHALGKLDDDRTFVEIRGTGNFEGSIKEYYVIHQLDLGNNTANVRAVLRDSNNRIIYDATRSPLQLASTDLDLYYICYGNTQLVEGQDYYFDNSEIAALNYSPGQMNLYVHGQNNCTNFTVINIDIYRELNDTDFTVKDDANAANKLKQGDAISETLLKGAYDAGTLTSLIDLYANDGTTTPINKNFYTATIDGYDIGVHVMTITGVEDQHYTGSISFTFNVTGDISTDGAYIEAIKDQEWTGNAVTPAAVYVKLPSGRRLDTRYYDLSYDDNVDPGYAKVTVTAKGIYSGELTANFKIVYPVNKLIVDWTDATNVNDNNIPYYIYDGTEKQPAFDLFYDYKGVKPNDPVSAGYTVTYGSNKNAGTGTVTITANGEDDCFLKGSVTKTIVISPKMLYESMLTPTSRYVDEISSDYYDYIPTGIFPVPGLSDILNSGTTYNLILDSDYKLSYGANNSLANGGTVTITGIGNYTGTLVENIRIKAKDLSDTNAISVTASDASYTGSPAAPGSVSVTYTDIFGKVHTLNHNPAGVMDYYISAYYTTQNVVVGQVGSVAGDGTVTEAVAPTEMGAYIVEIKGIGNYAGVNKTATYTITSRSLTAVSVSVQGTMEYTGNPVTPEITVLDGANTLTENVDFTIDYSNKLRYNDAVVAGDHTSAGVVTLTITGIGNYSGTVTKTMTITPRDIKADQATAADYGYTYAVNKSVTYANGNEATPGRHTMPFVAGGTSVPAVVLHDTTRDVDLGCKNEGATYPDYRLTFVSQYETLASEESYPNYAGKIVMTVEGLGNYTGSVSYTYYIGEDISGATATLTTGGYSAEYDGLYRDLKDSYVAVDSSRFSITDDQRKITVYKGAVLDDNGDLILNNRVDITKIVDADKYYIVVDGVPEKGTYAATPSMSCTYTVTPKSIFNCTIDNFPETVYYTGDYITIKGITVTDTTLPASRDRGAAMIKATLKEGVDYEIDNSKRYKDVGKATIKVNGIGNYKGTATAYYTIEQNSISGGDKDDGSTSGTGLTADGVTITAEDIRFTYTGTDFMKYTGSPVIPSVVITYGNRNLVAGKEYIVTATNNINAGIATLTISGIGGFSGYLSKKFTIKADLAGANIATIPEQVYTGSAVTPSLTVKCGGNTLSKGSDYTVAYDDNVAIGKAEATITAVENSYYYGSKTVNFNISNNAKGMVVTGYASTYTYTGYAITPALSVTMDGTVLTAGTDYVVSYSNNINVGTAKAVVTGKGQYSGTKTIEYRIVAKSLSNCAADINGGDSYEYTGSTYTPSVTLTDLVSNKTLVKGTDYNVTYSNNTDPGTATVTMTALSDNYTGTKVVTFNIGSAAVKGLKASEITWKTIKLKWTEQPYATGYQICDKNNKVIGNSKSNTYKVRGLTSYTTYSYKVRSYVKNKDGTVSYGSFSSVLSEKTKLKTPKLTVKAIGNGKVQLKWTKSRLATGYEIYYATEKNGVYTKLKTVSASNNRTIVDGGLASGEKYYYTVRAYRNVSGSKEYSNYNTIKGVTVR